VDLAAFLAVWSGYALWMRRFWFVTDDAYISFRYSRHLAEGYGLRFNLGEHVPVEGYSNFLHVIAGAVIEWLGLDIELWMPWLGFVAGSALLYRVFAVVQTSLGGSVPIACASAAFLGLATPFAVWSTGGLETLPFALLLFLVFEKLVLRDAGIDVWGAAAFGLLTALIRTEGILWVLTLIPIAAWSRARRQQAVLRPLASVLALVLAGYAAYFAWRAHHYGFFLPSTVHAKMGFSPARLARGASYVAVQYLTCLSLLAVIPGSLAALRRGRIALGLPVVLLAVAFPAYAVVVGGDFMTFGRFLVPGLPFTALLVGWMLQDQRSPWRVAAVALACGLLGMLPGWNLHLVPEAVRASLHFRRNMNDYRSEYAQWRAQRASPARWGAKGEALEALEGPGASAVLSAIGAAGYRTELFLLDIHGLVTPEVSMRRGKVAEGSRSPGHDHPVSPAWFVERGYRPAFLRSKLITVGERHGARSDAARWRRELREQLGAQSRYHFDIFEMPTVGAKREAETLYLFLWRHTPTGMEPADYATRAERRVDRALRGEAIDRVPMEPVD